MADTYEFERALHDYELKQKAHELDIAFIKQESQSRDGQSSFTIAPDTILEFELIGTAWKCVSNEWEKVYTYTGASGGGNISQYKTLKLDFFTSSDRIQNSVFTTISDLVPVNKERRITYSCYFQIADNTVYQGGGYLVINNSGDVISNISYKYQLLSLYKIELYGMK